MRGRPSKIPKEAWAFARELFESAQNIDVAVIVEKLKEVFGITITTSAVYKRAKKEGWKRGSRYDVQIQLGTPVEDNSGDVAKLVGAQSQTQQPVKYLPDKLLALIQQGLESNQVLAQAAKGALGWRLKRDMEARREIELLEKKIAQNGGTPTPAEKARLEELHSRLLRVPELVRIAQLGIVPQQHVSLVLQKNQTIESPGEDKRVQVVFELYDDAEVEVIREKRDAEVQG